MTRHASSAFSWLLAAGVVLAAGAAQAQAGVRVQMAANRNELSIGENVVVQIVVQTPGGDPEIELPTFDGFDVVQRSVQRPMSFSFGFGQGAPQVTSSVNYTLVLQPAAPGQYKIAPVRVTHQGKRYTSQPLVLTVRGNGAQPAAPTPAQQPGANDPAMSSQPTAAAQPATGGDAYQVDNDAFLRTVVDKTEPFLGEQVTATVFLYTRRSLQQAPAVRAEPTTDGFWVHDVLGGNPPEPSRAPVGGRVYWVYVLRRFAAFPLRTGELTIGGMTLTISRESIFDMLDPGSAQPNLDRTGVPLLVKVKPLPDAGRTSADASNVVVGKLELTAQLDRNQIATGDAVTLTATVKGEGNIASVRLATPQVKGLDVLQPETHELIEVQQDVVTGSRTFAWLIVAREPGRYEIPPLALETFDPRTQSYQRAQSAPLTLTAVGNAQAPVAAAQPDAPPPSDAPTPTHDDELAKLPPLHTQSALARATSRLADEPWFPWALLFAPCAGLASVIVPAARARMARAPGSETRERVKAARTRLDAGEQALRANDGARFHADVAAALSQLVAAKLGANLAGLTRGETRAVLEARGVPEDTRKQLLDALERCDAARFSPAGSDPASMQQVLATARACFGAIEALPTQAQGAEA